MATTAPAPSAGFSEIIEPRSRPHQTSDRLIHAKNVI
jgi:hypothetical protein